MVALAIRAVLLLRVLDLPAGRKMRAAKLAGPHATQDALTTGFLENAATLLQFAQEDVVVICAASLTGAATFALQLTRTPLENAGILFLA